MSYKYPKWLVLQLLTNCNLRCKMCYEWGETGVYLARDTTELEFETVKKIISESKSFEPYFELFGGEPLLYSKFEDLLEEFFKNNIKFDIPTNGTLLSSYCKSLVAFPPRRLWVSLDGDRFHNDIQRGKNTFDKILNGVKKLDEEKRVKHSIYPELGCTMVVTPFNYAEIENLFVKILDPLVFKWFSIEFELFLTKERYNKNISQIENLFGKVSSPMCTGLIRDVSYFKDIDLDALLSQLYNVRKYCEQNNINLIGYPKVIEKENFEHFFSGEWDIMKESKKKCIMPWLYAEIGADGTVTPCHTFYEVKLGNVHEESLYSIWNKENSKKIRNALSKNMLPACVACSRYYTEN